MFTHFGNRCQSPLIGVSNMTPNNTRQNLDPGGITFTATRPGGSPIAAVSIVLSGSASYETCISHLANSHQAA